MDYHGNQWYITLPVFIIDTELHDYLRYNFSTLYFFSTLNLRLLSRRTRKGTPRAYDIMVTWTVCLTFNQVKHTLFSSWRIPLFSFVDE